MFYHKASHTVAIAKLESSVFPIKYLADVCELITDGTHYTPTYQNDGVKFISVTDVLENEICFEDTKFISFEEHAQLSKRCLPQKNDILLTKVGTIGRAALVPELDFEFSLFVSVALIRLKEHIAVPEYVLAYLNSSLAKAQFLRVLKGIGVPDLHLENISKLKIPLPVSLETQKDIVKRYFTTYNSSISKLTQADELLSSMDGFVLETLGLQQDFTAKQMIYSTRLSSVRNSRCDTEYNNPHFTKKVEIIKGIPHAALDEIVEFSSESWNQKDFFDTQFPYIEISGVGLKTNEYEPTITDVSEVASRAKMIVRNGDIIVSTTRPHRGAIATISCKPDEIQIASTGFAVLRELKRDDVTKEYLQWILLNSYILEQMLQRSSGGNYPAINIEELKKIVIPVPDKAVQQKIADEAVRRRTLVRQLKEEANREWQAAKTLFEKEILGEV